MAATPSPADDATLYVMPLMLGFSALSDADFAREVTDLRRRLPEAYGVKVGFTVYLSVSMDDPNADPSDPAAVRQGLASTIAQIDNVIARARQNNVPVALSLLTATRDSRDPYQSAAEQQDRRNMQWYSDQQMAPGWVTYSRYARKQRRFFFAAIAELGKVIANRMALYPETLVAAAGDGEVELSTTRAADPNTRASWVLADFSPFAIAEFRDWLTGRGLYASGQPFASEAHPLASRYTADATPGSDESGDNHTFNGDFQTSFTTWQLKYFDWSLTDGGSGGLGTDANAIPAAVYNAPGFDPLTGPSISNQDGFDAPRFRAPRTAWLDVWTAFRSNLVWRYNREFARSITTSIDTATGRTVPPAKFFSYQIPGDYIFNGSPANPNPRLESSASSLATADVSPYGGIGVTAFNINVNGDPAQSFMTLRNLAPAISDTGVRWALLEWHPAVQDSFNPALDNLAFYREDLALVEQYRASLVVPFAWDAPPYLVKDSNFEVALRESIARIGRRVSWLTDKSELRFAIVRGAAGTASTSGQELVLTQVGDPARAWTITASQPWIKPSLTAGAGSVRLTVAIDPASAPAGGAFDETLTIGAADGAATPTVVRVKLSVTGFTVGPFGTFDSPADNDLALSGSVAVTGWALDDVEVTKVEIWRDAHPGDPAGAVAPPGTALSGKVFIGNVTFIDGSRPDVAAVYSGFPRASRAGWGYLMLTRGIIWDGGGPFKLYAFAYDGNGQVTLIGAKTVAINNAAVTKPFGAIDTPGQGQTVSGLVNNFGWVIARPGRTIPEQNVGIYIDGVLIGHPGGLSSRSDLESAFGSVGFDTSQAQRVLTFDSRTLADGLHTIGWFVVDNTGEADGVGSRFFRVLNGASSSTGSLFARPPR